MPSTDLPLSLFASDRVPFPADPDGAWLQPNSTSGPWDDVDGTNQSDGSWLDPSGAAAAGGAGFPDECTPFMEMLDFFHVYYIPSIILMGLVGNLLSCVVFLNTHLKMRSSSYYLAALACADFGFLCALLMVWLNNLGIPVFNRDGWCQGLVYISSVCASLSAWLIVAFTVERFIAVQYPLHRPHMCTVARAKIIVLALCVVALLLHSYSFWAAGIVQQADGVLMCALLQEYHESMRIINIVDSLASLIIPLVMIVVMNAMITRNLLRFGRRFKQEGGSMTATSLATVASEPPGHDRSDINLNQIPTGRTSLLRSGKESSNTSSSNNNNNNQHPRRQGSQQSFHSSKSNHSRQLPSRNGGHPPPEPTTPIRCIHVRSSSKNLVSTRTQQSITKMLLLISTVFILLNLPSYVIRLYAFVFFSLWSVEPPPSLWCMQQFFMLLYYTNFSINFLLYSMCGITFRRCLWQLILKSLKSLSRSHCNPQRYM